MARGAEGEDLDSQTIEREGEEVCGTPPTAANGLPPCADLEKQKLLNILQLIPISRMVKKENILMCRMSGALARDSWSVEEVSSMETPLNEWKCHDPMIRSLVSNDCAYYATAHAAFYYRLHPRV